MTVFSALLFSCSEKRPEPVVVEPLPFVFDGKLLAIDTLMQSRPDSALILLSETDNASAVNACFGALLLSEALYKTGNPQLNRFAGDEMHERASLQAAIRCFDSLAARYPHNDDIAVLTARSHYMNGVGYYENDSVVEACREYLHTLDIMEGRFGVETSHGSSLRGYKAKFMALTYNRLMELFSGQFMMESAIWCGEMALKYCSIETTSKYGVSNILYRLGKQYDKMGDTEAAKNYYSLAMDEMPDKNNPLYRDIVVSKAMLDYGTGLNFEASLNILKTVSNQAYNEKERLTRLLSIGYIHYNENQFDSAIAYLKPVYEQGSDMNSKIQAANFLRVIYDSIGDISMSNEYSHYIAIHHISSGKNQYLVSKLSDLYNEYKDKKMEENATIKRETTIIWITIVLILFVLFAVVVFISKHKSSKKMHAERLLYLKNQAIEMHTFLEEPICKLIMERVHDGQFKSHVDCSVYKNYALDAAQMTELRDAINRHHKLFTTNLSKNYPELRKSDIDYCCLYFLGLTEADIAALMQKAYNTVCYRSRKLKAIFGSKEPLSTTMTYLANNMLNNMLA